MKLDDVAKHLKDQADRYPRDPESKNVPLRHWARLKRGLVLRLTREHLGGRGECYNLMLHRDHARPSDTEIAVAIAAFFPGRRVDVIKKENRFRVHVLCPVNKPQGGECKRDPF